MKEESTTDSSEFGLEFAEGERIFKEGDLGAEMFIIESGEVSIYSEEDPEDPSLAVLGPGDFFGEMAVLEGDLRSASARALTACRLLVIDASTFDQMIHRDPEIGIRMMRKLAHRLRAMLQENEETEPISLAMEMPLPVASPAEDEASPGASATNAGPRLVDPESGTVFNLRAEGESTVGRLDVATGLRPDVDLDELNEDRSVSRRHARIQERDGVYHLIEDIGAANGTYLNSDRLSRGVSVPMKSGDRVRFSTVELVFLSD